GVERIGTLARLRRYPVKSMAGEDLAEARVTFAGLVGDRVYAFVDNQNKSSFPWMTGRQGPEMILFRPRLLDPPPAAEEHPRADSFAVAVTMPEGESFRMGDPKFTEYAEKRFGRSLHLRFSERSMTDAYPVSLLGLSTVRALSEETGINLDHRRFRANFYARWEKDAPFFEDELVGRELQIGEEVKVRVVKKDQRCKMITLDPETAAASPAVLQQVSRVHDGCTGVYGAVLSEGIVRANDSIYLV
ncbi:MAG TPA: MOSC N-terminal beta barrel domain-containing protein, partial [Candidatus Limnocylindria bacterium]|nr:MOSC N-terminal beta barrel domain-containing protein [Candidatus Limnocylindria bacterium]